MRLKKQELISQEEKKLKQSPLGKLCYQETPYSPNLLFTLERAPKREQIHLTDPLPFSGQDLWRCYEMSWLNQKGKPEVALASFYFPCTSEMIVESKSLKLYLKSLQDLYFSSQQEIAALIEKDLSVAVKSPVEVKITPLEALSQNSFKEFSGNCLDCLDVEISNYQLDPSLLEIEQKIKGNHQEALFTNIFRSNCPVTQQPDWASIYIHYKGPKIKHISLLKYLVSFRKHNEFHEQCIERIFCDILNRCQSEKLSVYGMFTRRGGIDINPFRSNFETLQDCKRNYRQ